MADGSVHTFAIGDIHGRAYLLEALLAEIKWRADAESFPYQIVFLGDVIDRGFESCRAMDLVIETLHEVPGSRLILGNHEWMLLRALDEPDIEKRERYVQHWAWECGGNATLASYGGDQFATSYAEMQRVLKPWHIEAFRQAVRYVELESHILVHAGLRPGYALEKQDPYDLMWIREPFLSYDGSFGRVVIHGHTPTVSGFPESHANRIAIDVSDAEEVLVAAHVQPDGKVSVLEACDHALGFVQVLEGRLYDGHANDAPSPRVETTLRPAMQVYVYDFYGSGTYFARASDGRILNIFDDLEAARQFYGDYEKALGFTGVFTHEVEAIGAVRKTQLVRSGKGHIFRDLIDGFVTLEVSAPDGASTYLAFTKDDGDFVAETADLSDLGQAVFEYEHKLYGKDYLETLKERISQAA